MEPATSSKAGVSHTKAHSLRYCLEAPRLTYALHLGERFGIQDDELALDAFAVQACEHMLLVWTKHTIRPLEVARQPLGGRQGACPSGRC